MIKRIAHHRLHFSSLEIVIKNIQVFIEKNRAEWQHLSAVFSSISNGDKRSETVLPQIEQFYRQSYLKCGINNNTCSVQSSTKVAFPGIIDTVCSDYEPT